MQIAQLGMLNRIEITDDLSGRDLNSIEKKQRQEFSNEYSSKENTSKMFKLIIFFSKIICPRQNNEQMRFLSQSKM